MHLPRPLVAGVGDVFYTLALRERTPVRWGRRIVNASAVFMQPPRGTVVEHVTLGGRPCERVTVGATERPRAILYLHGGGYTIGSPKLYRNLAAYLSKFGAAVVFNLDYRMAPEYVYPAALEDAIDAFNELVDSHGFAPDQITIAGDSAGGGLAVSTARAVTDAGRRPAALGLISPWTDPVDEDFHVFKGRATNLRWGRLSAQRYRGDADPTDPGFAPMYARLDGLPPTLIHVGRDEMLNRQIHRFATKATAAGVDVTLVEGPAFWHSMHVAAGTLRAATDAVRDMAIFLRAHVDESSDPVAR
jgi:monoterpene epsilon-lactone hydrolase